ncbi:DUF6318 family protein [Pedococcus sp. 2YAF34]|uniref:DUF6318 family protein n=1 Tax=Pedococcus sp. 2YAF34 TaxID=3233032 RepID=UPI003F94B0C8
MEEAPRNAATPCRPPGRWLDPRNRTDGPSGPKVPTSLSSWGPVLASGGCPQVARERPWGSVPCGQYGWRCGCICVDSRAFGTGFGAVTGEGSRRVSARHRYGAAGLALLVLTVSACSDGGGEPGKTSSSPPSPSTSSAGSGTTTPSSSPPSSATATVDPADLPADARKHTPEGAAAFVKHYVNETNRAGRAADPEILRPFADPGCKSCAAIQATIETLQNQDRHYTSDPVEGVKVKPFSGGPKGQQFVRLQMLQRGADIVDKSGKVVDSDKRMNVARTVSVVWRGDSWIVYGIA